MKRLSRRDFCRAAAGAAAPYVITSTALGAPGRAPASERIVMGAIGLGGRGRHDMQALMNNDDVQMVAVCDVQATRRKIGKLIVDRHYGNSDCVTYRDFRELLARDDIDAVLVATGDNWQALASIMAAKAGKDIYSEKPMSLTVGEGRGVADTVKRYGVVYQCGTQRRSVPRFAYAVELARSGKLGELKEVWAEKAPFGGKVEWFRITLPPEPEPPADFLDWNMWLGPAQWRPYNHRYITRGFWALHLDFSGGAITEWGSHTVDLCQLAVGQEHSGPVEFELDMVKSEQFEEPRRSVVAHYANGVKLIFEPGKWPLHVRFVGTEGWIYVDDDGNVRAEPKSLIAGRKFGRGYPATNHIRNFLDCVKSRRTPIAPAEQAHRSNTVCQVANICVQLNRPVKWIAERERFDNDPEADAMLYRAMRQPWRI